MSHWISFETLVDSLRENLPPKSRAKYMRVLERFSTLIRNFNVTLQIIIKSVIQDCIQSETHRTKRVKYSNDIPTYKTFLNDGIMVPNINESITFNIDELSILFQVFPVNNMIDEDDRSSSGDSISSSNSINSMNYQSYLDSFEYDLFAEFR